jgi:hypothetical protein
MKSLAQSQAARRRAAAAALASVGAGILGTQSAEAEILTIEIGPSGFNITGVNGGVTAGTSTNINNFPTTGAGNLILTNAFSGYQITGLSLQGGPNGIAAAGGGNARPVNFAAGTLIDATAGGGAFYDDLAGPAFRVGSGGSVSPDFGPNSFLGFRDALGRFGYIETTWNSTTNEFRILSAAYESVAGVAIRAGDVEPSAVPEIDPTGLASTMSLVMGSVAMLEQRRRRRAALAAESTAVTA